MPIRLSLRYKGGAGSGNKGHAGIKGHLGGSRPKGSGGTSTGEDNPAPPKSDFGEAQPLADMFTRHSALKDEAATVSMIQSGVKKFEKLAFYKRSDMQPYYVTQYNESLVAYNKAKATYDENKKKFSVDFKGVKAPGFGEWVKDKNTYSHPNHPEWGKVEVHHFGGMGRFEGPSSWIEYGGGRYDWSGQSAKDNANKFMNTYFGTDIYIYS